MLDHITNTPLLQKLKKGFVLRRNAAFSASSQHYVTIHLFIFGYLRFDHASPIVINGRGAPALPVKLA